MAKYKRPTAKQLAENSDKAKAAGLRGYHEIICEATGIIDAKQLEDIENCMRHTIFHSTLDWQSREELHKAAIESIEVLKVVKHLDENADVECINGHRFVENEAPDYIAKSQEEKGLFKACPMCGTPHYSDL